MKKKVAILGSTGSIGKKLLSIIDKDKKNYQIVLLVANRNYKILMNQAKKFKVKNLIINDQNNFEILMKLNKNKNLKIYNSFENFNKIFKKKIEYTMSAISGLPGLVPTFNIIKYTKTLAIANKESIICGWSLLRKEMQKHKTKFIPVDSEHFSIAYALNDNTNVEKIILTASGGPFNKLPINKFKKIKVSDALNHPNWNMGKKISIDSSTMMNKVFEVIEAKKIFNLDYKKISILIHPLSYIHAIIKFNDGMIKLIAHETDMRIPIHNTLYFNNKKKINSKLINLYKLNNLNFKNVNIKKFPSVDLLKEMPDKDTLFDTILVVANDQFVSFFIKKEIKFTDIAKKLKEFINRSEIKKYKNISPNNINDIINLSNYIKQKINSELHSI
jgi:1-deoxy-D-xylulose-5-phosphate reductoisomerase